MKIQYLLSEKTNINSFLYVLKTLSKNFSEVLFNFNKSGMSISQFWEDKNTERAKYFFYFDTTFFSKISCPNENVFFRLSLKEILQKLKSHKKEIQEIYITVHNEPRDRMPNDSWCLVEFMVTLDKYGSMLYRNGCSLEKPGRDFSPITYYQHLFANKELFFSVEPKKIEKILGPFKNEYTEMYIKEDKMELSSLTYTQKINIKILNCFKEFRYQTFSEIYENVNNLINPPHHLAKYAEVCIKCDRDMVVYVNKNIKPKHEGIVKMYCPLRSEKFLMILKFKMKIGEYKIIDAFSSLSMGQMRIGDTISNPTISISNGGYDSNTMLPAHITRASYERGDISQQLPPRSNLSYSSNSTPHLIRSDPVPDISRKTKRNDDFQFSQESSMPIAAPVLKKVHKTPDDSELKTNDRTVTIDRKAIISEPLSMMNSYNSYNPPEKKSATPLSKNIDRNLNTILEKIESDDSATNSVIKKSQKATLIRDRILDETAEKMPPRSFDTRTIKGNEKMLIEKMEKLSRAPEKANPSRIERSFEYERTERIERSNDRIPDRAQDRFPERIPERVPEKIPERVQERIPERMPERKPEKLPERAPERMPERIPERDRSYERSADRSNERSIEKPLEKMIKIEKSAEKPRVIADSRDSSGAKPASTLSSGFKDGPLPFSSGTFAKRVSSFVDGPEKKKAEKASLIKIEPEATGKINKNTIEIMKNKLKNMDL